MPPGPGTQQEAFSEEQAAPSPTHPEGSLPIRLPFRRQRRTSVPREQSCWGLGEKGDRPTGNTTPDLQPKNSLLLCSDADKSLVH